MIRRCRSIPQISSDQSERQHPAAAGAAAAPSPPRRTRNFGLRRSADLIVRCLDSAFAPQVFVAQMRQLLLGSTVPSRPHWWMNVEDEHFIVRMRAVGALRAFVCGRAAALGHLRTMNAHHVLFYWHAGCPAAAGTEQGCCIMQVPARPPARPSCVPAWPACPRARPFARPPARPHTLATVRMYTRTHARAHTLHRSAEQHSAAHGSACSGRG